MSTFWITRHQQVARAIGGHAAATAPDAPTGPQIAGDYEMRFLDENTAVMAHSAGEPDPHWSMHVWKKMDGMWQVVATLSTPIED